MIPYGIARPQGVNTLTHWGRVTHICVSKLTIIGSDNSLSPGRRQAIIWTNDGILLIRTLGTTFSEIVIEIQTFSLKKMRLKMSSAKRQPFCLGLNVLRMVLLRMVLIVQSAFPNTFSWKQYLYCVPMGPTDNKSMLMQVIIWKQTGNNYLYQWWPSSLTHIHLSPGLSELSEHGRMM